MGLFPTPADETVFWVVYGTWLVFVVFIERAIIGSERTERVKTREDRGSALVIYLSVFVSLGAAFGFAVAGIAILPDWVFYVGIAVMVLGIFVREWAVTTLRGYFSFTVRVLRDHKVIDRGPYRRVRHPAYTGGILTIVGVGVALRSWVAVLLLLAFCGIAYGYRMSVEEAALLRELGEEYSRYASRTKRLIPYVI